MKEFILKRDGEKDLRFKGEELAWVTGQTVDGPGQNRWNELTLYKAENGKYIVYDVYRTQWQGENDCYRVTVCDNPEAVFEALEQEGPEGSFITDLAKDLIDMAAAQDESLQGILIEDL